MKKIIYDLGTLDDFEKMCEIKRKDGPPIIWLDSLSLPLLPEDLKEYKFEEVLNMSAKKLRSILNDKLNKNDIATLIKIGKQKLENKATAEKKEQFKEIILDNEKEARYKLYKNVSELSRAIYHYYISIGASSMHVISIGKRLSSTGIAILSEYSKTKGLVDAKFIEAYLQPIVSYLISHDSLMCADGAFSDPSTIARIVDHIYPEKGCGCGGKCHSNSSKDKKFKLAISQGVPAGRYAEEIKSEELPTAISGSSEKDTPTKFLAEVIIRESFGKLNGNKQDELISIIRDAVDYLEKCDVQDIDKYRAAAELGMFKLDEHVKYYDSDEEYTNLTNAIKDRVKYLKTFEKYSKYITSLYDIVIGLESWSHIVAGARDIRIKDLKLALLTNGIINQGEYVLELLDLVVSFHESYILVKCGPNSKWGTREYNINSIVDNLYI